MRQPIVDLRLSDQDSRTQFNGAAYLSGGTMALEITSSGPAGDFLEGSARGASRLIAKTAHVATLSRGPIGGACGVRTHS